MRARRRPLTAPGPAAIVRAAPPEPQAASATVVSTTVARSARFLTPPSSHARRATRDARRLEPRARCAGLSSRETYGIHFEPARRSLNDMPETARHRIVVVGGGFAGLQAALKLAKRPVELTLVDRRNFHLFQPLAYQVATGALSPSEICYPLRTIFRGRRNVEVVLAEVAGFDLDARRVELRPVAEGVPAPATLEYDSLIVAGGSRYSYFGHDDWHAHAPELKSLEGALDIRSRILTALEAAEWEPDRERRRAWLTFVVVGAGPTGVEMAGQIAEIARDSVRDFRRADTAAARVLLVEVADRVLTGFPPSLSTSAERSLQKLGVTPLLEHTVTDIDGDAVTTSSPSGEPTRYGARTVVWAAGVAPSGLARALADADALSLIHI